MALLYLLCDTYITLIVYVVVAMETGSHLPAVWHVHYIKWQEIKPHSQHTNSEDYVFYAALEWDIYTIFAVILAGE